MYLTIFVLLALLFYFFFLIVQLALFNLVIVGILFVFFKKVYNFLDAVKEKFMFNYKTKDFNEFIDRQNANVY